MALRQAHPSERYTLNDSDITLLLAGLMLVEYSRLPSHRRERAAQLQRIVNLLRAEYRSLAIAKG